MRIFLSYASEHRDIADQIQLTLAVGGYSVFFDRDDLPGGGDYDARISAAVAQSDLMLFLVSKASVAKGSYALTELKYARMRWPSPKDRVLPIMIEPVDIASLPPYLKAVTILEPEGSVPAEVRAAVNEMADELKRAEAAAAPTPSTPADSTERPGPSPAPPSTPLSQPFALRGRRTIALIVAGVLAVIGLVFSQFADGNIQTLLRVALLDDKHVPFNHDIRSGIDETVKRLNPIVRTQLLQFESRSISPWELAQGSLAVTRSNLIEKDAFTRYVRKNARPSCACWTELMDKPDDGGCVFISGWMLAALARYGAAASPAELKFLLDSQSKDGWWPVFPINEGAAEHGSSYATAWALMGLYQQKSQSLVPPDQVDAVNQAIDKGSAWLLAARDGARWKFYPADPKSKPSVSVSGAVLHALHVLGTPNLARIDALWLDALPRGVVAESEMEYHVVPTTPVVAIDHIEQIKLPWTLMATVDAYPNGNWMQKSHALHWMEAALRDPRVTSSPENENRSWWRAELLYALRYSVR